MRSRGRSHRRRTARGRPWPQANASPYYARKAARRRRWRLALGLGLLGLVVAVVAVAIWGFRSPGGAGDDVEVPDALLPETGWDPWAALQSLIVIDEGTSLARTPYDRDRFGQRWADVDRNGCDTRNDMLRRDLAELVVREGTQECVAESGTLVDPYTGGRFVFERGSAQAGELHVDHVVALADAWHKGAEGWSEERRTWFANDPTNLVVTLGHVNQAKGAGAADSWVPPQESARCGFAVHVVRVKDDYDLAVSAAEASALTELLGTCGPDSPPLVGTATVDGPATGPPAEPEG